MSWPKLQAVLFDLDGTLIDSAADLGAAADRMRTDRGLTSRPLSDYRPYAGAGARGMLQVAFGLAPEEAQYEAMREEFFCNYERGMLVHTRLFDQVQDLLAGLMAQGLVWGIVTNKSERFTLPLVRALRELDTASVVICGDTTAHAKPHPEPLLEAARRLGVEPRACLYVGDDLRDMQAAQAAGMRSVAASYGYLGAANEVSLWGADFDIQQPLQLLAYLDEMG